LSAENVGACYNSKTIAAKLYFDWLVEEDILNILSSPGTPEKMVHAKEWPKGIIRPLQKIFDFLVTSKLFVEAGGTYVLSPNFQNERAKIETIFEEEVKDIDPSLHFIRYGLTLLRARLDNDVGNWHQKNEFIFEKGFTQYFIKNAVDIITEEVNKQIEKGKEFESLLIISRYLDIIFPSLLPLINKIPEIKIVVPNQTCKDLGFSFLELDKELTKFERNVITYEELDNFESDIIIVGGGFGFDISFKKLFKIMGKSAKFQGDIYCVIPMETGLEPLFEFHPSYIDYFSYSDMQRYSNANSIYNLEAIDQCKLIYYGRKG
jgi:hypothetical protein